jgi:hypothetical protein
MVPTIDRRPRWNPLCQKRVGGHHTEIVALLPCLVGLQAFDDFQSQVADFLSQRVAVHAEELGGADLVASCGSETDRD